MKFALAIIGINLSALTCVIAAAHLAVNGIEGWGWFLLVAILCAGSVKFKDND